MDPVISRGNTQRIIPSRGAPWPWRTRQISRRAVRVTVLLLLWSAAQNRCLDPDQDVEGKSEEFTLHLHVSIDCPCKMECWEQGKLLPKENRLCEGQRETIYFLCPRLSTYCKNAAT